jgi:hypothetical protein
VVVRETAATVPLPTAAPTAQPDAG